MPAFLRVFLRISARRPESPRRPHPLRTQSPGAKSLLGVAQGQVRSPQAVSRLPQFQVAAYSLLLLASLLSSGFQRTADYLPLPKWRRQSARPSLLDLLNLLRQQIFARGIDAPVVSFDDFASAATPPDVKSSKLPLAAETIATLAA